MAGTTSEIDAGFFQLIHQVVSSSRRRGGPERRDGPRRPFDVFQQIAPWDGGAVPDDSQFTQVKCHDLTCSGFSFFLPKEPKFQALVAEFGQPPDSLLVGAKVLHVDPVLVYPSGRVEPLDKPATGARSIRSRSAASMMLVGCRFVRRLRRPPTGPRTTTS